jgi:hypothetical protein
LFIFSFIVYLFNIGYYPNPYKSQYEIFISYTICSVITQQCTQPVEVGRYKDHYDCATAGFINAMGAIREIGVEEVNKNKLLVNFYCKEQETI